MGLLFALFFELDYKGSKVIRSFLMAPLMIAPLVAGLTWKLMMSSSFGIVNELLARVGILSSSSDILWLADEKWSLLACCIADIWLTTPFMMLMILAGLQGWTVACWRQQNRRCKQITADICYQITSHQTSFIDGVVCKDH